MSDLLPDGLNKNEFLATISGSKSTVADAIDACTNGLSFAKEASEGTPVGWMVKLFDIHSLYQANKLKRNILSYLAGTEDASAGQKNELIRRLQSEPEFLEEYASVTLTIWNEAEHPIKAKVVGRLAYNHAIGNISNEQYINLSYIVHSASVPSLHALKDFFIESKGQMHSHAFTHRLEPLVISSGFGSRYGSGFRLSEEAGLILRFGLDVPAAP